MSLTLDPTLQTRLDGLERQPAIELLSSEFTAAIPFQGNSFGIADTSTFNPHLIAHSSGRLGQFYIDSSNDLQWMYTDTDRAQWSTYDLSAIHSDAIDYVTACELADGNIGVVVITSIGGDQYLRSGVIAVTGEIVTALSQIEALSDTYLWSSPHVIALANDDYYLMYVRETADTAWALYARTCTTWGTWGAAADKTPAGLTGSQEIENPSLCETAEGDLFLLVDHVDDVQDTVTISNVYSAISTDDGASFGAATARTSYTEFGSNGLDPIMLQRSNGTAWLMFYENVRVLHMDNTATGFLTDQAGFGMGVKDLHFDSTNDKIIVTYGNSGLGTKSVGGVAVIDKATWTIDKVYYSLSTPAFNTIFNNSHVTNNSHIHGDGKYLAMVVQYGIGHTVLCVIDHDADSVTHYVIDDTGINEISDGIPAYSLDRNVEYDSEPGLGVHQIQVACVRVDAANDMVYLGWDGGYRRQYYMFSKIDLTDVMTDDLYPMTWITSQTSGTWWPDKNRAQFETAWQFELDMDNNYIIAFTSAGGVLNRYDYNGTTLVLSLDTAGAIVKRFDVTNTASAPRWGLHNAVVHEGSVYGTMYYCSAAPHTDQRGLVRINYMTDTVTYYRPGFVTTDQYFFQGFAVDDTNDRIYCASPWGIARFDMSNGAWTLFSSDTLPGFVRSGEDDLMGAVQYDSVDGNVMGGSWNDSGGYDYLTGINMFNENGAYNQLQYITGDKTVSWAWDAQLDLSYYSQENMPAAALDPDDVLWVTWNHVDWAQSQNVLYWDNDMGSIDVSDDIVGSVVIGWQLKRANSLAFELANGHLYDPQNLLSTKSVVGQKGRKVIVRIGEHIGVYIYWVNQGTFLVDTAKMTYKRGEMPTIQMSCVGKTALWRDQQVSVSPLYSGSPPDDVLVDLIGDFTQMLVTEYDIPTFDAEHNIFYQWIGETLWSIIEEVCDHFFYAMYEDVDGVFTCRKVDLTQAVDHEYTDNTHLTDFGPDDEYSDYTNQVRVIGEAQDYTEVVHNEEVIATKGGTVGWWVKETTEKIYYSEDRERQCRSPRVNVVHSPTEYGLLLSQLASGEGGIEITEIDTYEHYAVVTVRVQDLTGALVAAILAMLTVASYAIRCDGNKRCGAYVWATSIASSLVFYILAAMAQYQYELWGHPLGKVKTSIQYEANDEEFQRKIRGEIITNELVDPLCTDVTECKRVADGNLAMITAQRRRLTFSKLAHLQDELLDKVKVYHPYSGEGMEVLVVGLQRTYTKGQGVFDKISGWRYIA